MVEGARLESVYRGNSIAGSNPAFSAAELFQCFRRKSEAFLFPAARRTRSPELKGIKMEGAEAPHWNNSAAGPPHRDHQGA